MPQSYATFRPRSPKFGGTAELLRNRLRPGARLTSRGMQSSGTQPSAGAPGRVAGPLRPSLIVGGALLAVVAVAAVWFSLQQPAQAPTSGRPAIAQVGAPAPAINLPIVGGGTSDLAADRGKVVLVNFWATWCEPCKSEMPGLQQLADELRNQPFRLYSIDLQEDAPQIEDFQKQYGLNLYALMDQDGEATHAYGVRALPSTFLIDQNGVLHLQRLGQLAAGGPETMWSEAWLADQVRSLLASG